MNWQNGVVILIVALASVWAVKMCLTPFIHALRPGKAKGCSGGCGCGHEEEGCEPAGSVGTVHREEEKT